MTRREKAIKKRRLFILTVLLVILIIAGIIVSVVSCNAKSKSKDTESDTSDTSDVSSDVSSKTESSKNESPSSNEKIIDSSEASVSSEDTTSEVTSSESSETETASSVVTPNPEQEITETADNGLDKNYKNLMLVNGSHSLPDNYDSEIRKDLVEIDAELRNNDYVKLIHKSVYPYITAMVRAAQADGVDLKVWSPFRSYADQNVLFQNQVNRVGGDEAKAATVVARPGTSEHNTGICADFNMADDAFETTPMFTWMNEHAAEYGFILRYPKDKQNVTGVIYESWHWRFVGINTAKKIKASGLCLEEYLEKNNLSQKASADNF